MMMPTSKSRCCRLKGYLFAIAGLLGCIILFELPVVHSAIGSVSETDRHLGLVTINVLLIFSMLSLIWNHPVNTIKKSFYGKTKEQTVNPVETDKKGIRGKTSTGLVSGMDEN